MSDNIKDTNIEVTPEAQVTKTEFDALAKAIGQNPEELQVVLKELVAKKSGNVEAIDNVLSELKTSMEGVTEEVKRLRSEKEAQSDSDRFDEVSRESFIKAFEALPDDQKKSFAEEQAKKFGARNVTLALTGSEMEKALSRPISKSHEDYERIQEIRQAHDYAMIATALNDGVHPKKGVDKDIYRQQLRKLEADGLNVKGVDEALDTATATEGTEWVPTILSDNMVQDVYLRLDVAGLFPRYTMTSKTFELPIRIARGRAYRMAEATTNTQFFTNLAKAHNLETGKVTFVAEKIASLQFLSDELSEDSVLPIVAIVRDDIVWGAADAIEDAVINGSTGTTDLDNQGSDGDRLWMNTGDAGTSDARNAWDGLRKLTVAGAKTDLSGILTLAKLRTLRSTMGKYGVYPTDLAWIIAIKDQANFLNLDEVVTLDKYGPQATVMNGEIGRIDGSPIIISERMYQNLNASGVFDNSTTNKSVVLCVNRLGYGFGDRRLMTVESERSMLAGQQAYLATWRGDFQKLFPSAEALSAFGYNL